MAFRKLTGKFGASKKDLSEEDPKAEEAYTSASGSLFMKVEEPSKKRRSKFANLFRTGKKEEELFAALPKERPSGSFSKKGNRTVRQLVQVYDKSDSPITENGLLAAGNMVRRKDRGSRRVSADVRKNVSYKLTKREIGQDVVRFFLEECPKEKEPQDKPAKKAVAMDDEERERRHKQKKRAVGEVLSTEETYVRSLETLLTEFMEPMREDGRFGLTPEKHSAIFLNIEAILELHRVLLDSLKEEMATENGVIASPFLDCIDYLKIYTVYLNGYADSIEILNECTKKSAFRDFLAERRASEACRGLDIMSYLIMPVQRIPRYEMLLKEVKANTPPSDPDYDALMTVCKKMTELAQHLNDDKRRVEDLSKLLEIKNKMTGQEDFNFDLVAADRKILKEGEIYEIKERILGETLKKRRFYLMNDLVLWTNLSSVYCGHFSMTNLSLFINDFEFDGKPAFEILVSSLTRFFVCDSEKEQLEWVQAILEAAALAKH